MDKLDILQIDSPENWVVGNDILPSFINYYANFPVKLKCEVFVFCLKGNIEATVNLVRTVVVSGQIALIPSGSIIQVHSVSEDVRLYYLVFSQSYLNAIVIGKNKYDVQMVNDSPIIGVDCVAPYYSVFEKMCDCYLEMYNALDENSRVDFSYNVYQWIHSMTRHICNKNGVLDDSHLPQNKKICRDFDDLVQKNFFKNRKVEWYASQLGLSQAYLSSVIKSVTGSTCTDKIAAMVIMDSKSRLKLTGQSIQSIAEELNFADASFFCKYFKRYVGMSPLEFRDSK